jgi:hypothetical protein
VTDDDIKRMHLETTGFDLDASESALIDFARVIEQASRRAALEEAWTICNANAAKLKDSKETASGYVACVLTADDIRALAKGDKV